ncbi:putative 2-ketoarginine decarboxylase AruI [Tateyamaria omphalii]|uniref:thiamine pyrophosphate-binding protein n=1 Tax=Tateyamaria omphalii TaxID=299262 RepID=UPI0016718B8A|nr:thiamine pyrophosphate-binding protein [Tateyamaria omphalii]GGX54856.1 putative 2-ketoarginine decarboxylase AruI [Tateyamaria omphalii]
MAQTRPLGAQISHMLKDRGVDVIFGIPGVHNQEMYRGIEEAGITHVLARHEQGAGFMADGYARATGKPGVAYVITGPGLCNIMTPMGQAYSDSVPMLVISSCLDEMAATKGQLHQMKDQRGAAETVCDWSEEARTADAAYALVDRAIAEFKTNRPRPKHIQVPIQQLETHAEETFARWRPTDKGRQENKFSITRLPGAIKQPMPLDVIDTLAIRLLQAERPLFVFGGGGARQLGASGSSVTSILELANAAVFTTYAGRGVAPPDWPLLFGSSLARPESAKLLDASDCVVLVGTDLAEVDLWRSEAGQRPGAYIVNIDPEVLSQSHPKDWCLQYDAATAMAHLHSALEKHSANALKRPKSGWSADLVAGYRDRWRAEVDAERPGIVPVCDALRSCLPEGTMIYSDMTQFAYTAKEVWDMEMPGHWHHPTGFGTLGYATPAAIGGAVARKGKPTMAIIGDYGFHYTMQELGVAVELGLPLPIILWDNGKLKEIEESMVRAQIAPNAVVARNPDFCKLAEAFGAYACAPKTLAEMQDAVRAAFDADGPTLIYLTPEISA